MLQLIIILFAAMEIGSGAELAAEQRLSSPLTAERILPAMLLALDGTPAEIEIVDMSRFPVPDGKVEFSLADLNPPAAADAPTRWRGFVLRDTDRKFSIWAMVRIKAECKRVVATERLEVGQPILAGQVHEETYLGFPLAKDSSVVLADILGRAPLRTLKKGSAVRREATGVPVIINAGADLVAEFHSGRFRITAPVTALGAGRLGDAISVRNPSSKKIFKARVLGPGHVVVEMAQ